MYILSTCGQRINTGVDTSSAGLFVVHVEEFTLVLILVALDIPAAGCL